MTHRFLSPVIAVVIVGWTAAAVADDTAALARANDNNSSICRLQSEGECLKALEKLASTTPERAPGAPEMFALLVNGDTSDLHNGNVEMAYRVLRNLGVPDDRIYILSNTNPRLQQPSGQPPVVSARATIKSFSNVLYYLSGEVGPDDCLLVYTTGHGIRERNQSALCLNDGLVLERDLARSLDKIRAAVSVVVMDQCFSGGFADALQKSRNTVAMTNTDGTHDTYCEYFASAFWMSLMDPDTDLDENGQVSLTEAYEVAMAVHRLALAETPERAQGRLVEAGQTVVPCVALDHTEFLWKNDTAQEAAPARVLAQSEESPRFRRSRLAGHRAGYRP